MIMSCAEACKLREGDRVTVAPFEEILDLAKEKGWDIIKDEDGEIEDIATPAYFVSDMQEFCGKSYCVDYIDVDNSENFVRVFLLTTDEDPGKISCVFDNFMLLSREETDKVIDDKDFERLF